MTGRPRATYRVQLNRGFGFRDVARIAPYLSELGVTHIYCSPYLQAEAGSTHGYDVVDHTRLNAELGGRAGFEEMVRALQDVGLAHIVDIVPNHVSIGGPANAYWWDVLKHGRTSRFAPWFDIDWDPPHDYLKDKVLMPVLGDDLQTCLERDEIALVSEEDGFIVRYFEHECPIDPATVPKDPSQVDLRTLLAEQHYVLAHWRVAARHLNYRRFFDISTLAALRMEQPGVFEETHGLILDLVGRDEIDGLRVDHVDGLRDPQRYLERLRGATSDAYVVVEKILEVDEQLPATWPVEGTTGYDFLNLVQGLFVDPEGEGALTDLYAEFTGESTDLEAVTRAKKFLVMRHILPSDITRLISELGRAFDHEGWEWDEDELRVALAEVIAALPVYRTYVSPTGKRSETDVRILHDAFEAARSAGAYIDRAVFDRIEAVAAFQAGGEQALSFMLRFQQTTGSVMAKSVEDTVFYNYNRFVALNEVGGDPARFGISVDDFHRAARRAAERWPLSMLATSTHDTKRSEDVRARLALLSEIPRGWADMVRRLSEIGERHRSEGLPDRNAEYLMYQTLVGAWPLPADRAVAYINKAAREAKAHTSWLDPKRDYEEALERFVRGVLRDEDFVAELERFVAPLIRPGRVNSLAQTLIKLTYPGCPDIYQGTELWDLSLVDPDNRRPVDFDTRARLLEDVLREGPPSDPLADDGRGKLFLTSTALQLRARRLEAFGPGSAYAPLEASGAKSRQATAYARGGDVTVVAPRLVMRMDEGWGDTVVVLPVGRWRNVLTGSEVPEGRVGLTELLDRFPVALLERVQ